MARIDINPNRTRRGILATAAAAAAPIDCPRKGDAGTSSGPSRFWRLFSNRTVRGGGTKMKVSSSSSSSSSSVNMPSRQHHPSSSTLTNPHSSITSTQTAREESYLSLTNDAVVSAVAAKPILKSAMKKTDSVSPTAAAPPATTITTTIEKDTDKSSSTVAGRTTKTEPAVGAVVKFARVQVHHHSVVLGDNPAVSKGLPITLGWDVVDSENWSSLDKFECEQEERKKEKQQQQQRSGDDGNKNHGNKRPPQEQHFNRKETETTVRRAGSTNEPKKLSAQSREELLLMQGHSRGSFRRIQADITRIKRSRMASIKGVTITQKKKTGTMAAANKSSTTSTRTTRSSQRVK